MVDEPDVPPIFRNRFEEAAPEIVALLNAEVPPRFERLRSFDYRDPGKMVFTGLESAEGRPMVFTLTLAKRSAAFVDRGLPKAIIAYGRGA